VGVLSASWKCWHRRSLPRCADSRSARVEWTDARAVFRVHYMSMRPGDAAHLGAPQLGFGIRDVRGRVGVPCCSRDRRHPRQGRQRPDRPATTLACRAAGPRSRSRSSSGPRLQGTGTLSIGSAGRSQPDRAAVDVAHPQFHGDFSAHAHHRPDGFKAAGGRHWRAMPQSQFRARTNRSAAEPRSMLSTR